MYKKKHALIDGAFMQRILSCPLFAELGLHLTRSDCSGLISMLFHHDVP